MRNIQPSYCVLWQGYKEGINWLRAVKSRLKQKVEGR